jgi:hypothetical protein
MEVNSLPWSLGSEDCRPHFRVISRVYCRWVWNGRSWTEVCGDKDRKGIRNICAVAFWSASWMLTCGWEEEELRVKALCRI